MRCRYPHHARSHYRRGFSLTEILVCLAVLGLLVAIVLPIYYSVKTRTMVVQGVNNHKQVTATYLMYLNDHNGVLWYRSNNAPWTGGSGGIFGAQNYPNAPGYICYLLERYGLERAEWNGYKEIPNRSKTVWYSPPSLDLSSVQGHGATYFYYFLGSVKGDTIASVGDKLADSPYMRDYYGNYNDSDLTYSTNSGAKLVYSYLDGHTEYRTP